MMNRLLAIVGAGLAFALAAPAVLAQQDGAAADQTAATNTQAAAAVASRSVPPPQAPDYLEGLVDAALAAFNVRDSGNTVVHYSIAALLLVVSLLARRIVTGMMFPFLRKLAARTRTTLDDKLFPALESPVAAFIMLLGIFGALRVLKLNVPADRAVAAGATVAFSLVVFWGMWRALAAALEHATEVAKQRQLGIAAFMPWIRKSLMTVFVILGVLLTIQSLGYDVKAILAGLGIGGLAFALAAQDTLANVFGAVVVAVDQPFRLGEVVRIQGNVGMVEDIGVRSTRIRLIDGCLMVIPNKTVAGETITNLSRFIRRRFEQIISLTYDTPPEKMAEIVDQIRGIITAQPEVDPTSVLVFFRDFSASSLDIWMVYNTKEGDFVRAMNCKQRIMLEIMRAVEARGLSFAFPTQTVQFDGELARKFADAGAAPGRLQPPGEPRPEA